MTVRQTILLTMAVFALQPLALGAWLALIPQVKADLGLSKSELAVALLGNPIALIPGLQLAARVLARFGPRRVLAVCFPIQSVLILLPLFAVGQWSLFAALAAYGIVMAHLQVGLNVYAGRLEKSLGVAVMNRCHGFWALGLMGGSLAMALLVALPDVARVFVISGLSGVAGIVVAMRLPRLAGSEEGGAPPRRHLRSLPLALLLTSVFALIVGMTEGAMADWSAVYLAERWPDGVERAGIAVSIYAGCLAVGRFFGDAAKSWLGTVLLARSSILVAILGLALVIGPWPLWTVFAGFALIGFGASVGFPLAVSAVAALDDRYEGANIAVLSTIALTGFLIGPPTIGFLADAFGLRIGLGVLLPLLGLAFWLARWLTPVEGQNGPGQGEPV